MKISTKGRYGLRAVIDLAINYAGEPVSLNSIAQRQGISENYLEQVFSTLRKAGIVKSIKGAQGGYMLADNPSKISVGTVLNALEGSLVIVEGTDKQYGVPGGLEYFIYKNVWEQINKKINNVVDSISLEDLANEYKRINENLSTMYYI